MEYISETICRICENTVHSTGGVPLGWKQIILYEEGSCGDIPHYHNICPDCQEKFAEAPKGDGKIWVLKSDRS